MRPQDKYKCATYYGRGWKVPKGYPFDKKSQQDIKQMKKEHGNGWWVFVGKYLYK